MLYHIYNNVADRHPVPTAVETQSISRHKCNISIAALMKGECKGGDGENLNCVKVLILSPCDNL